MDRVYRKKNNRKKENKHLDDGTVIHPAPSSQTSVIHVVKLGEEEPAGV